MLKGKTNKALHEMTLSELISEYKKSNGEASKFITIAMELDVLVLKKEEIELKVKECEDYISEVAKEFIKRFS